MDSKRLMWSEEKGEWWCWGMGLEWVRWQAHRFLPIHRFRLKGDRSWRYDWGKKPQTF